MSHTITAPAETISISFKEVKRKNNFNDGWKFYLGTSKEAYNKNFSDATWTAIRLPHDFSIFQPFTTSGEAESGFLPAGTGWYRKTFTLPKNCANKRVVLNFDGSYSDTFVYVNGNYVGEHHYGYTAFAFDITDFITCDGIKENLIAVKVVNTIPSSRWYSGSGIFRDVTLVVTDEVHVTHNGTYVTTPDIEKGIGTVKLKAMIANDGNSYSYVIIKNTIYTKDGICCSDTVTNTVSLSSKTSFSIDSTLTVNEPKLWSVESPNLYVLRTELFVNNTIVDSYDTTFGFRYFKFDSETGFHLNGKQMKLNGVCMHHDQGALGAAAYYDAMYRQLSIMKNMGVNAIRTSHNPVAETFIDICNKIGLLVIEEAFDGWNAAKNGNVDFAPYFYKKLGDSNRILGGTTSMIWSEFVIKSMVKRDRNAPCIILWSLGNEIQEGAFAAPEFPSIAISLIQWANEIDPSRRTTIGSNMKTTWGILGSVHRILANAGGILGFNYANRTDFEMLHAAYGPIIASETASAINSRGMYMSQANASNIDGKFHLTSYDTSTVGWGKTAHESIWDTLTIDYVGGEFVWTGFDYIGEPTPWNGTGLGSVSGAGPIPNSSYFGIVDTTGFEKDTYYLYRSQWNTKHVTLHLVTAWDNNNIHLSNGKTPVSIYSNAPVVKLYRNDICIGIAIRNIHTTPAGYYYHTYDVSSEDSNICTAVHATNSESLYASFDVEFVPGTISAKAYDIAGNAIINFAGTASISTPDVAQTLHVETNTTSLRADGSSLAYISVDVRDKNGNFLTTATNRIEFSLTGDGEIVGVDNGDQATIEKYQQLSVLPNAHFATICAYAGKALAIVRSTKESGNINIKVTSEGLEGTSIAITTTKAEQEAHVINGLIEYNMIRDYTVVEGTIPTIETSATGIVMNDGVKTTITGHIIWNDLDKVDNAVPGDYKLHGYLYFDGYDLVSVIARVHVIANVVALRNISTVTMPNTIPTLPDQVNGITEDGTLSGEFTVVWDEMKEEQFSTEGTIVVINGYATILGTETLPVTASVRVSKAINTENTNVAPVAIVTQDIPLERQSDNLASIINGITNPGDKPKERWSNWNNRTNSATATIGFEWATAQLVNHVNLYYYFDNCAALPASVAFEYSLNGQEFTPITATEELIVNYTIGAQYMYTFENAINPIALRITFTQQDGTIGTHCVALTEAEVILYAGMLKYNESAEISSILFDGDKVTASSKFNAGITVLPTYENVIRILAISEDGENSCTYEIIKK